MPKGPAGGPRPLTDADMAVEVIYPHSSLSLNEDRLRKEITKMESFPLETGATYRVNTKKTDAIGAERGVDTVVEVIISPTTGRVRSLLEFGEGRDLLTVSKERIDMIEQKTNVAVDREAKMVNITIR